jgi:hypothetical protein
MLRVFGILARALATWLVISLVVSTTALACSQCTCGSPFPADLLGGATPMQIRFGMEDRYLSKSNALDQEPGEETEHEHRLAGFALWRPDERAALMLRLPYAMQELIEHPQGEAEVRQTTQGFSDLEAQALFQVAHSGGANDLWLALVAGGSAPTGSNELENDSGERLEAHLQPGTGAWTATGGVDAVLRLGAGLVDLSLLDRWSDQGRHGYQYGNVVLYNLGFTPNERGSWQLLAELNGRSAARDQLEDGTMGEHTGGTVLYFTPGVRWRAAQGVIAEAAVQIPVVESLYGIQDEHATARLALSMGH